MVQRQGFLHPTEPPRSCSSLFTSSGSDLSHLRNTHSSAVDVYLDANMTHSHPTAHPALPASNFSRSSARVHAASPSADGAAAQPVVFHHVQPAGTLHQHRPVVALLRARTQWYNVITQRSGVWAACLATSSGSTRRSSESSFFCSCIQGSAESRTPSSWCTCCG